jgi:hypothetical protein
MTRQVRIVPAALSAAIVLVGFGYVAVGRAGATDTPATIRAADRHHPPHTAELAEVRVTAPPHHLPLSVWNQS